MEKTFWSEGKLLQWTAVGFEIFIKRNDFIDYTTSLDSVVYVLFKPCGRLSFPRDFSLVTILIENIRNSFLKDLV